MASTNNYRDVLTNIKQGNFASVYLLMGEEAYFLDLIASLLEKSVVDEGDRDFNQSIFFGNDADIDYVIGAAKQFPVMAPRKLVMLKEAQTMQFAKSQLEKFAPYCNNPSKDTVFVIVYKGDSLNANGKLVKAVNASGGIVFKSDVPRSYQLPSFVRDYCTSNGASIDQKAVEMLCDFIGTPLSKLYGEINKLISIKLQSEPSAGNTGRGSKISIKLTAEDVERHIGVSKDFNNFELIDAVSVKDYPKAMRIVKHFEQNPKANPTPVTVGSLYTYFSNLVIAHYLPDCSEQSMRDNLGLKSAPQFRSINNGLKRYNARQAVNAIHYLREFDIKSKGIGSAVDQYALLNELIFKIFT